MRPNLKSGNYTSNHASKIARIIYPKKKGQYKILYESNIIFKNKAGKINTKT